MERLGVRQCPPATAARGAAAAAAAASSPAGSSSALCRTAHLTSHAFALQGYDELNTLERPLVSDVHEQEEYERQHGTAAPGGYRPPAAGGYTPAAGYTPAPAAGYPPAAGVYPPAAGVHGSGAPLPPAPSQADELQELSLLARDAAEILWEMVAMGEGGAAAEDMKVKAGQLQAQLRGLIGDYTVRGLAGWGRRAAGVHGSAHWACPACCAAAVACSVHAGAPPPLTISSGPTTVLPCPLRRPMLQGGDEAIFARAFESFDMLSRCLEEVNAPAQPKLPPAAAAVAGTGAPAAVAPPAAAPAASRPAADEAPLISFD